MLHSRNAALVAAIALLSALAFSPASAEAQAVLCLLCQGETDIHEEWAEHRFDSQGSEERECVPGGGGCHNEWRDGTCGVANHGHCNLSSAAAEHDLREWLHRVDAGDHGISFPTQLATGGNVVYERNVGRLSLLGCDGEVLMEEELSPDAEHLVRHALLDTM